MLIAVTNSPSIPSCLDRQMSQSSDLGSTAGFSCAGMSVVDFGAENDAATAASLAGGCVGRNNRSASRTRSMNWSSNEGSSCDTMSVALSEMPDGGGAGVAVQAGDGGAAPAAARAVVAVVAAVVAPEEVLALHLALEAGDVAVAKVLAEVLHLLQLQEVYPQDLNRLDHLFKRLCPS